MADISMAMPIRFEADSRLQVSLGRCAPCLISRPDHEIEAETMYNGVALCKGCLKKFAREKGACPSCGSHDELSGYCVYCGCKRGI